MSKYSVFSAIAIGSVFAWHGHPYVKASESTANPVERDGKSSVYAADVPPSARVVVAQ